MANKVHEIMLRANTALFAQKICQILQDMSEYRYSIEANSLNKSLFTFPGGYICFVHFAGKVQGDYILAMSEITAAKLAGISESECCGDLIRDHRKEYSLLLGEALNIAVGKALPELEKRFEGLTINSPTNIYGEIIFPKQVSGNVDIDGECGKIQCTLSINMASLKIIREIEKEKVNG